MPFYEHVFLARQDLATNQVEALTEEFSKIVVAQGGRVASQEYWGLRTLAYRIAKNRKAHYVMLVLDAPAAAVAEMERNVSLNEDVIRFMTVRIEALPGEASAMLRRGDRAERGERGDRPERDGAPRGPRPDRSGDRGGDRAPRAAA
jgi:small subunit ribosomal protein S6